jgi:hypothetical protein
MKRRIAQIAAVAFSLGACAETRSAPETVPTGSEAMVGWIQFRGEFLLYPRQEDVGRTLDGSCISGTFARTDDFRTAARRFEGKRVRIVGRSIPADAYFSDSGAGQRIENYCGSNQLLIATTIDDAPLRR